MFCRSHKSLTSLTTMALLSFITISSTKAFSFSARSSLFAQRSASVLAFTPTSPSLSSFAFGTKSSLNMSSSSDKTDLLCVHVFVTCKPGTEDAFKEASLANARESAKEEGIARFDVIQQIDDPTKFVLVEVYKNGDAPAAHKETAHYNTWRETVADMMAEPRSAIKYKNHFPSTGAGWDYGASTLE